MMYSVGLTGNIGTGKSTVAAMFKAKGVTVLSADVIARELTSPSQCAWQKIIHHYGREIAQPSGEIDRSKLRNIIFKDPAERLWLEALLHPLIRARILENLDSARLNPDTLYCMVEIPLLLDRTDYPYLNRVLLIVAPPNQKIQRLMERDGHSAAEASAILLTQPEETSQRTFADDILINDGDRNALEANVLKLHQQYLAYAKS